MKETKERRQKVCEKEKKVSEGKRMGGEGEKVKEKEKGGDGGGLSHHNLKLNLKVSGAGCGARLWTQRAHSGEKEPISIRGPGNGNILGPSSGDQYLRIMGL